MTLSKEIENMFLSIKNTFGLVSNANYELFKRIRNNDRTLITIDFEYKEIKKEEVQDLAGELKANKTVTSLSLCNKRIGYEGLKEIAKMLNVNTTLIALNLKDTRLKSYQLAVLADALKVNSTLAFLNLSDNDLWDDGTKSIAEALKVNTTLAGINFSNCSIGHIGVKHIAEMLKVNNGITTISISSNGLGVLRDKESYNIVGIRELVEVLKFNKMITHIYLGDNDLYGDDMGEVLEVNNTLASLNLRNNSIGSYGVEQIAKALKINNTLTEIDLSENFTLDDKDAKHLIEALKTNNAMTHIDLRNNKLSEKFEQEIKSLCDRNAKLRDELFEAVKEGNLDQVKAKLKGGVSIFVLGEKGNNLLHLSVIYNQPKIASYILSEMRKHHTDPLRIRNLYDLKTPGMLAQEAKNIPMIEVLRKQEIATLSYVSLTKVEKPALIESTVVKPFSFSEYTDLKELFEPPSIDPLNVERKPIPELPTIALKVSSEVKNSISVKENDEIDLSFNLPVHEEINDYLIPEKELKIDKEIGRGAFGVVYLGFYHGSQVAIKKFTKPQNLPLTKEEITKIENEIKVMKSLDSPRVVHCYGAYLELDSYRLVMEYVEGGTLYALLYLSGKSISRDQCYQLAIEIGAGMAYLHNKGIINGDPKSSNVLLDKEGHAKIADFGESKKIISTVEGQQTIYGNRVGGTPDSLAPELLRLLKQYAYGYQFDPTAQTTKKTDAYSYGIMLSELFLGRNPYTQEFKDKTYDEVRDIICERRKRKEIKNELIAQGPESSQLQKYLRLFLFSKKPEDRPEIADALIKIEKEAVELSLIRSNQQF
jgi:tRNA A-37 threonylcarbamoyl transferase component Bud32